jgi:DNA-binding transcriptional regulator GbsR (MarR family)
MTPEHLQFIERMGAFGVQGGLPRSAAHILAYLSICEPKAQSAEQVAGELRLSSGSVSAGLSLLRRVGLIDRITRPGSRRHYYELNQDGWKRATLQRFRMIKEIIPIAEQGLKASPGNTRLLAMRDIFVLFDKEFEQIAKKLKM